ncbi:MAG: hypothetical protein QOH36_1504, partial [Actinomycetota bacterium]|nr:hypothetical protein [Actinomycetota bacterium]
MSQQAAGPYPPPGHARPAGPDQNPSAARQRQRAAATAARRAAATRRRGPAVPPRAHAPG